MKMLIKRNTPKFTFASSICTLSAMSLILLQGCASMTSNKTKSAGDQPTAESNHANLENDIKRAVAQDRGGRGGGWGGHGQQILVDLSITPENDHNLNPQCPPDWVNLGSNGQVIDSGNGISNGVQQICARYLDERQLGPGIAYIADISISDPKHQPGGVPCPFGSERIQTPQGTPATITDCSWGKCYGNQLICVKRVYPRLVAPGAISQFYVTEQTQRDAPCATGYERKGGVADCSMGKCQGNQSFCTQPAQ